MTLNELKSYINQMIYENNERRISGTLLNEILKLMVDITTDNINSQIVENNTQVQLDIITPTSPGPSIQSGIWFVTQPGTYTNFGGVVLPKNSTGFILKNGSSFSISYSTYDDSEVKTAINQMNDFIENFAVEVDQYFDPESENAIANKEVSKLANSLNGFLNNSNQGIIVINPVFNVGIISNSGSVNLSTTSTKLCEITVLNSFKKIIINCKKWAASNQNAVDSNPTILAKKHDGTFEVINTAQLVANGSVVPNNVSLEIDTRFYTKIFINALNAYANNTYCNITVYESSGTFSNVKEYIDDKTYIIKSDSTKSDPIDVFDTNGIKKGYAVNSTTGAEVAVIGANISNFIEVKQNDEITFNSDRAVVFYSEPNGSTAYVKRVIPALDDVPTQYVQTVKVSSSDHKYMRFVFMDEWTGMFAKKVSLIETNLKYIDAEDVKYKGVKIEEYLNNSNNLIPVKPYIYPLRKKIINASIRENDIIAAIGNSIVKYGLNEAETIIHTINSVSDWRCVWTSKSGITYFSPMNSYSNGTDASNYGLYRYDGSTVTRVIQLSNRQSVWGIDEDNDGNIYAGVYDLGGSANPSLYKSIDNGVNFSVIKSWPTLRHIHDVMIDKNTNHLYVFLGDTYAAQQNFKSIDGGETWLNVCPGQKIQMTDSVATKNYRFFGTDHSPYGRIYRTSDDIDMEICLDVGYYSNVFFMRVSDLTGWVYAGFKSDPSATGSGLLCSIWVSKDEGESWQEVKRLTAPVAGDGFWFASEFKDGNLIIGCRQGGNGHNNWQGYGITENANLFYDSEGIVGTRLKSFL